MLRHYWPFIVASLVVLAIAWAMCPQCGPEAIGAAIVLLGRALGVAFGLAVYANSSLATRIKDENELAQVVQMARTVPAV